MFTVCLALFCVNLTLCLNVTPEPGVPSEETISHAAGMADEQPLELRCPNDNQEHFISTGWYTCSGYGRMGLYRISENKTSVYAALDPGLADAHNITRDGTLLVSPRNCSQERVYICDRWANIGRQNQCWLFTVRNCTVRMSTDPARDCSCTSPKAIVTSSTVQPAMTCGLIWLSIAVLTIVHI